MSARARNFLIVTVFALAIPLLAFAVFWVRGAQVIAVRNDCGCRAEVTATISDGVHIEQAQSRSFEFDQVRWFYFFPEHRGPMMLHCVSADGVGSLPLGVTPAGFQYSAVVFDSCDSMTKIPALFSSSEADADKKAPHI